MEHNIRRVVAGASIGNAVEWFDFAIYGFLATYIAADFFPAGNETTALLNTFAIFAAAFFVRPLGGFFFGPLGDRIGRQKVLAIVILFGGVLVSAMLAETRTGDAADMAVALIVLGAGLLALAALFLPPLDLPLALRPKLAPGTHALEASPDEQRGVDLVFQAFFDGGIIDGGP